MWRLLGGRKFLGFIVATVLAWTGRLSGEGWLIAFGIYAGFNVAQKVLLSRHAGPTQAPYDYYDYGGSDSGAEKPVEQDPGVGDEELG